eukprot:g48661.t1
MDCRATVVANEPLWFFPYMYNFSAVQEPTDRMKHVQTCCAAERRRENAARYKLYTVHLNIYKRMFKAVYDQSGGFGHMKSWMCIFLGHWHIHKFLCIFDLA